MGDQQSLIDDAGGSEANDVDHAFEEALHSDEEEQLVDDEQNKVDNGTGSQPAPPTTLDSPQDNQPLEEDGSNKVVIPLAKPAALVPL